MPGDRAVGSEGGTSTVSEISWYSQLWSAVGMRWEGGHGSTERQRFREGETLLRVKIRISTKISHHL